MHWQTKKLGDVCDVITGQSPEGNFYNKTGKGLPFYQGKKEFTEKYLGEPTTWTTKITKEANEGDVLISVRAPVGPVNFATNKICIGRGLSSIRSGKEIDKDFLFNFLQMFESEIVGNAGAVFSSINKTQIENIEIPLPSLAEQKRIVKKLDEVFEKVATAKENAEKNLRNSRELFESYLQSVFAKPGNDWEERKFGEIILEVRTGPFGSALHKSDYIENGIPVVNPQDIVDGKIVSAGKTSVSKQTRKRLSQYILEEKDIVLARRGEMGRCALVTKKEAGWLCGTGSLLIRLKSEADERFVLLVLQSVWIKKELETEAIGTTMSNLNQGIIKALKISMPLLSEQETIVKKLDALSVETKKLEKIYAQKLADLEELKKSVLKKAFAGEL